MVAEEEEDGRARMLLRGVYRILEAVLSSVEGME